MLSLLLLIELFSSLFILFDTWLIFSLTIYFISTKLLPNVNNSSFSFPTKYFLIFKEVLLKSFIPSWHVKKKEINNSSLFIFIFSLYLKNK